MSQRGMDGIPQLKTYRETEKLSQEAAGRRVGVSRETWARWELGHRKVARKKLPAVAEETKIPRRELRPDLAEELAELMGQQ